VSVAGVLANLLALPVVAPIMWLGMCGAALAQLPAVAPLLAAPVNALAEALAAVSGILLGYLAWLARLVAEAPGATLTLPLKSPVAVAGAYGAIAAAALMVRRGLHKAEPSITPALAAWRRLPARVRLAAILAVTATTAIALVSWTATPSAPRDLTVSFLDVGQGDATLIQAPDGASVLFDGGVPEANVSKQLKRAGVTRLSLVVATHQSRDHHGGLQAVVERFQVDTLLANGDGTRDPSFVRLVETARSRGVRVIAPHAGETLSAGALRIHIYGPPPRRPGPAPDDPNKRAIPAIVSLGDFDLFLAADAESDALAQYGRFPDVDAMKVSHHGSADPGLPRLLDELTPQVAAIEVGKGNSYGHPTASTLSALRAAVPHVYRTDEDGTIRVTVRGGAMDVVAGR
jgi:competence protein ComEC